MERGDRRIMQHAPLVLATLLLAAAGVAGRPAGAATNALRGTAATALRELEAIDAQAVALALADMAHTWPQACDTAQHGRVLAALRERDALCAALREGRTDATGRAEALAGEVRAALVNHPLLRGRPILFVVRPQFANEHGPDETMFQSDAHNARCFAGGGALKVLDVASGGTRTVLDVPGGIARDPVVHFDGRRILFSLRRDRADDYHLYEIQADGSGLRQLTFAPRVSDIQPVWLPNGDILFSATREPKYIHCQRHLMASLFLMAGDGANIRQVGFNTLFEGRGSLLPDGRVLYSRWEYVDKHFSSAYGLWTANPDGTAQQLHYGGLAWQPGAILDGRAIPGSRKLACIFGSVHDHENGALVIVDPTRGNDGPGTIERSWPPDLAPLLKQWNVVGRAADYDSFCRVAVRYQNPYPLSDKYVLCARSLSAAARQELALFLVDVFGNETLLHREAPGCFQPVLLGATPPPPAIPARASGAGDAGVFYVADVYRGYGMSAVPRGAVKWLRVVEAPAKLTYPPAGHGDWSAPGDGESHQPTAVNWHHYNNKRVLGVVPVEPDGSAHFTAPARRFVYFQLLDESGLMVHSMRSGTALLPGETQGCGGCHDYRAVPPAARPPAALRRPPSPLRNGRDAPPPFSYAAEVQPILDRHCVRCHDYGKAAGAKLNLSGDAGPAFNASYVALMARSPAVWALPQPGAAKPLVSTIGTGPLPVVPPYSWGAHRSGLVDRLRAGHQEVKLAPDEWARLVTWIDLNAPYYPVAEDYYSANTYGRSPLDHGQLLELGRIVAQGPRGAEWGWQKVNDYVGGKLNSLLGRGELPVNFTRPACSACLRAFDGPADAGYARALALIEAGRQMLAEHPRADMPGFRPCAADQQRLDAHAARQRIDEASRRAWAAGARVYDERP